METAMTMDGPIAIRYPKGVSPSTPDLPVEPLHVGRWEEVRKGRDICFLAVGRMVAAALDAAERLAAEGIEAGVINARWIKPMDGRLQTEWAESYPVLVTVEDNVVTGGFGAGVLEALSAVGLAGKVHLCGLPDKFLAHAQPQDILAHHGLDGAGLAARARAVLHARQKPVEKTN
jgi:1-deoxy-D-xylulose-5-phosphate synthase